MAPPDSSTSLLPRRPLRVFATVGSTRFDSLVHSLMSPPTLRSIAQLSYQVHRSSASTSSNAQGTIPPPTLTIQYGRAPISDILISPTSPFLAAPADGDSGEEGSSDAEGREAASSSRGKRRIGIDPDSALVPAPGLRFDSKGSISWTGVARSRLDPGMTGSLNLSLDQLGFGRERDQRGEEGDERRGTGERDVDLGRIFYPNGIAGEKIAGGPGEEEEERDREGKLEIVTKQGVKLELVDFVPDLKARFEDVDVVVSHAGSGSIIECLRMPKPPLLIVVPNTGLMDNHQVELAEGLERRGHLLSASPETLPTTLLRLAPALQNSTNSSVEGPSDAWHPVPFPPFEPQKFRSLVDETLGFE